MRDPNAVAGAAAPDAPLHSRSPAGAVSDPGDVITLAALGDIMLHGRYDALVAAGRADVVFASVRQHLAHADLVVGNLECVPSRMGTPRADKLCLRADPAYLPLLAQAGVRLLSLANNHSFDFGLEALEDVRARLEALGIATVGAGRDLATATAPAIIDCHGHRCAFLAFCDASTGATEFAAAGQPGVAALESEAVLGAVERWRDEVDHLVLLLHWGLEYVHHPTPDQARLAQAAIAHGARLVLGHHSHVLHGVQQIGRGLVAYSLGNLTDAAVDWQGPKRRYTAPLRDVDREGALLRVSLDRGGVVASQLDPLWLDDDGQPGDADVARAARIRELVRARSADLGPEALERLWEAALVERRVLGPLQTWWRQGSLLDKIRRFNLGQIHSLYLVLGTWWRIRRSRSAARWSLINPRNDRRPMPSVRPSDDPTDPP